MKKRNKMLLITSMVLAACGSLCLGRSLTTLPGKECPQTEQVEESETKDPDFEETQDTKSAVRSGLAAVGIMSRYSNGAVKKLP